MDDRQTIEFNETIFVNSNLCNSLKYLGFKDKCVGFWTEISFGVEKRFTHGIIDEKLYERIGIPEDFDYLAPTWEQAYKWFETNYGLVSWISPLLSSDNKVHYYIIRKGKPLIVFRSDNENDSDYMKVRLLERLIKIASNEDEAIKLL